MEVQAKTPSNCMLHAPGRVNAGTRTKKKMPDGAEPPFFRTIDFSTARANMERWISSNYISAEVPTDRLPGFLFLASSPLTEKKTVRATATVSFLIMSAFSVVVGVYQDFSFLGGRWMQDWLELLVWVSADAGGVAGGRYQ